MTKSGQMREMLIDAIAAVRAGKLDSGDGATIAKLAGAVSQSLQVEINAVRVLFDAGIIKTHTVGELTVGGATPPPAEPPLGVPRIVKGHAQSGSA